jgi:hypothetical protein
MADELRLPGTRGRSSAERLVADLAREGFHLHREERISIGLIAIAVANDLHRSWEWTSRPFLLF